MDKLEINDAALGALAEIVCAQAENAHGKAEEMRDALAAGARNQAVNYLAPLERRLETALDAVRAMLALDCAYIYGAGGAEAARRR